MARMSAKGLSILVFGIYLAAAGLALAVIPGPLLALLHLAGSDKVWIRIVGVLCVNIGLFCIFAARANIAAFYNWMYVSRAVFVVSLVSFVVLGLADPVVLVFAAIDALGMLWTALAPGDSKHPCRA